MHLSRPALGTPAFGRLLNAGRKEPPAPPGKYPHVRVMPSADGTVLIVGTMADGAWVAEYRCLREDFDEQCLTAMESRVSAKERERLRIVP